MFTKKWKVYGADGHRQRESFASSVRYDWGEGKDTRIVEVQNADTTGTHDFTVVIITCNTEAECNNELMGQLSDGIFENSRVGKIEVID